MAILGLRSLRMRARWNLSRTSSKRRKGGGYAMGPMAKGIRITTGAELTGPDALATPVQLASAEASARELIDLGKRAEPEP